MLFPDIARDDVFILGSQRLWLRWPRLGDVEAFAKFAGDNSVSDMTASWPYPLPAGEVEKRIAQYRIHNLNGTAMVFVMTTSRPTATRNRDGRRAFQGRG